MQNEILESYAHNIPSEVKKKPSKIPRILVLNAVAPLIVLAWNKNQSLSVIFQRIRILIDIKKI